MKNVTLLTIALYTSSLFAYELLNFSSTTPRSEEEILLESGMTRDRLVDFSCDNPNRMDLFYRTTIANLALDSLKIYEKETKRVYSYISGKLYDSNNRQVRPKNDFVKRALKLLRTYETIPETRDLVFELQASPYTLYLVKGGNRFLPHAPGERSGWHMNDAGMIMNLDEKKPMIDRLPFSSIGFGGFINWNPKTNASFVESDGKIRKVDPRVVLAHEMMHAYDSIRGLLDRRFVKSDTHEFQPVTEYRAVRMENILRASFGQKYRKYYSSPTEMDDNKDMLDENGETIILPTPCISWL
jgi:hypothetical protein